ncbi:MAG: hypothetical protein K0V04_42555 [Deltaproteobacteria bacterium]|nr:hypothetical protein [Deltaproteobacteria bacterium]
MARAPCHLSILFAGLAMVAGCDTATDAGWDEDDAGQDREIVGAPSVQFDLALKMIVDHESTGIESRMASPDEFRSVHQEAVDRTDQITSNIAARELFTAPLCSTRLLQTSWSPGESAPANGIKLRCTCTFREPYLPSDSFTSDQFIGAVDAVADAEDFRVNHLTTLETPQGNMLVDANTVIKTIEPAPTAQ